MVSNMLFDHDHPRNTLIQIEVIFNNGSTIYIYIISFRINILVFIFISKKLLMKYHDKIQSPSFEFVQRMRNVNIRLIFVSP